jgi:RHS repeat-associated protein
MRKSERIPHNEALGPSGRQIDRTGADGTTEKRYYADGLSPILVKRWDQSLNTGAGAWKTVRTAAHLPGVIGHVAAEREPSAWNSNGTVNTAASFTDRYYHYDPLGNTVLETGTNGSVLARTDMEAYGEMVREANPAGTWSAQSLYLNPVLGASNRPRQTTKETDPDTGLRWFGARWYDPAMGSWISPERLKIDGPNLYWGSLSSPSEYVDPDGNVNVLWGILWGAAYGGIGELMIDIGRPGGTRWGNIICGAAGGGQVDSSRVPFPVRLAAQSVERLAAVLPVPASAFLMVHQRLVLSWIAFSAQLVAVWSAVSLAIMAATRRKTLRWGRLTVL